MKVRKIWNISPQEMLDKILEIDKSIRKEYYERTRTTKNYRCIRRLV